MTEGEGKNVTDVVVVEPPHVQGEGGGARLLLLCDHASNRLPTGYEGVPDTILSDHGGWDIGALGIARVVARELSAGLVWSNCSRLVIDVNRGLRSEQLIRRDWGLAMNAGVDDAERQRRIDLFYQPYHRAIDEVLDGEGSLLGVIAIHTFTPILRGERRKWEAGLIYDRGRAADLECASVLLEFLRGKNFCVGDNEPYPVLEGDSLAQHGEGRGLVGVGIEVRNDLVRAEATQEAWGVRLAQGLRGWLENLDR